MKVEDTWITAQEKVDLGVFEETERAIQTGRLLAAQAEKTWPIAYEEGRKADRKEVVAYVNPILLRELSNSSSALYAWQNRLKVWGIEENDRVQRNQYHC